MTQTAQFGAAEYGDVEYGETGLTSGWTIDGTTVTPTPAFEAAPQTIGVTFQTSLAEAKSTWRSFEPVDTASVTGVDGQYRTFSERGVSPITVEPATTDQPPFASAFDAHVVSYQESPITDEEVDISLRLARTGNIATGHTAVSETGDYELAFASGTIGLDAAQVQPVNRNGSHTGAQFTLPILIGDAQAATLLDNCNAPGAVVEREIADADNRFDDSTIDDRHTISLTTPADSPLNDQTLIVQGWSLSEIGKGGRYRWQCELSVRIV